MIKIYYDNMNDSIEILEPDGMIWWYFQLCSEWCHDAVDDPDWDDDCRCTTNPDRFEFIGDL